MRIALAALLLIAPHPARVASRTQGSWTAAPNGAVAATGGAAFYGDASNLHLNQPVIAIAGTPDGDGYWLAAADGGVFGYGDAAFHGSVATVHLNQPVVAIAATPTGVGYWLAAADGGVFAFGDAGFYGSAAAAHLAQPIVTISATGAGYSLTDAGGRVRTFGPPPVATPPPPMPPLPPPPPANPYASPNPSVEQQIATNLFDEDNTERSLRGLPPVRWDPNLAAQAVDWSYHDLPQRGSDPPGLESNVIGRGGCPTPAPNACYATTNLPTDGDAHIGWMYSAGHRANILDPSVTAEGVGVLCASDGILYATEIFSAPPNSPGEPAAPLRPIAHDDNSGLTCDGTTRPPNGQDNPTAGP